VFRALDTAKRRRFKPHAENRSGNLCSAGGLIPNDNLASSPARAARFTSGPSSIPLRARPTVLSARPAGTPLETFSGVEGSTVPADIRPIAEAGATF